MKKTAVRSLGVVFAALSVAVGCGPADQAEGDDVGSTAQALAPSGSGATVVGSTIPASMYPGERRLVTVSMKNTGAASPANDWTTAAPSTYVFSALTSTFNWFNTFLPGPVPVGGTNAFPLIITAPATSSNFVAQMRVVEAGAFGQILTVPVAVSTAVTPEWGCTLVSSTLPDSLAPGENRFVNITVQNTGTATWPATNLSLVTRDVPANLWGQTGSALTTAVAPGGTTTFGFNVKAPPSAGAYQFQRDMKNFATIGDFRVSNLCVTKAITVGGLAPYSSTVVSQDFPLQMATGETKSVTVTLKNTGTQAWNATTGTVLYSQSTPVNLWGFTVHPVTTTTAPGADATVTFDITAPAVAGTYAHRWQLRNSSGSSPGFFGAAIDVPVTVVATPVPLYRAELVSMSPVPPVMVVGNTYNITFTVKNTGSATWQGREVFVAGYEYPEAQTGAGVSDAYILNGAVIAPGQTYTFVLPKHAAQNPGQYSDIWYLWNKYPIIVPFLTLATADVTVVSP